MNVSFGKTRYAIVNAKCVLVLFHAIILFVTIAFASSMDEDLIRAAKNNDIDALNALIKSGANVNARGDFLSSPLLVASQSGSVECAKALIEAGADVNIECYLECTPLIWAADTGHTEIVKLLLENGAYLEASDYDGWTALMKATFRGNPEIVQILVEKGANVNVKNSAGYSVLYIGETLNRPPEIINMLVKAGAKKSDEICCTWVNTSYHAGKPPQKISFHYDGTYARYAAENSTDALSRGVFQIVKKWADPGGYTWYKIMMDDPIQGRMYKLAKVSDHGKKLEFVCKSDKYPVEINAKDSGYCNYLRASVN